MKLVKQSGLYVAGRIVPAAIGLCGVALYTRLLDPATIGEFALLVSTTFFIRAISYTWLSIAALRTVAGSSDDDMPDFFRTILVLFIVTSVVVVPLTVGILHAYRPELRPASLALAAGAVIAAGWYELTCSLLQGRLSVQSWSLLNFVRSVGTIGITTLLIFMGWKLDALLAGFALGHFTTLLFANVWGPGRHGSFDIDRARRYFYFGWPQSASAALAYAAPVAQRWILAAGAGAIGLGIFSVAQDFSSLALATLIGSVSIAGIPLAFKAKDRGDERALLEQLDANARLIFGVALPATVGLCVLADPLSHVVFGPKFQSGAATILMFVAFAGLAVNLRTFYFDQSFELAMRTRPQAIISVVSTVVLIVGCVVLVPRYAAVGAAIAALISSLTGLMASMLWGKRILAMPIPAHDWLKTTLAAMGMGLVLAVTPRSATLLGLGFDIFGGLVVYAALSTLARLNLVRTFLGQRLASFER